MIQPIAATLSLEVVATGVRNRTYEQRLKAFGGFCVLCLLHVPIKRVIRVTSPTVLLIEGINSGMGLAFH